MHKLKSHQTVENIARKHRQDISFVRNQLRMGIAIEKEHTKDKDLATDIALQHLDEFPDYYTKLKKMESDAKKEHKKFKDVKEDAVTDLQRGIVELPDASYDSIDNLMRRIMKKRKVTAKQLHNDFVDKHNQTPDTWAKKNMKEEKKGLWANIHARREKGLPRKKPGQKGYPETLNIDEDLKQARKNVGASKCWPGKVAKGTKIKDGIEVPDCKSVNSESTNSLDYTWNTPIRERPDRYCPKCEKLERRNECKYGTKYWDMFSLPAEIISSKKDYNITMPHPGNMPEEKDHEYSMARSEISTIISAAKRLKNKLKGEGNIEAWVQSKITKAADYIDTAADYLESGEHDVVDEACWVGYKQVGMKKKGKKMVPNCVKESVSIEDLNGNHYVQFIDIIKPEPLKATKGIGSRMLGEGPSFEVGGNKLSSAQEKMQRMSPSQRSQLPSQMVKKLVGVDLPPLKSSPSSMVKTADSYEPQRKSFTEFMTEAPAAWQRKEGKNPEGGLNKKGIASYRKENPGSRLSLAVTTKPSKLKKGSKSANRRKSFCSRMSGMKDKLTSAKTANDPNSRINKSLRKWNC